MLRLHPRILNGCGRSSGVEHNLAKVRVVSSNLIARSKKITENILPLLEQAGKWQGLRDSNPRPSVLETDALPTELNPYFLPSPKEENKFLQELLITKVTLVYFIIQKTSNYYLRLYFSCTFKNIKNSSVT